MDENILKTLRYISTHYEIPGTVMGYAHCNNGHINETYRVQYQMDNQQEEEYIFQRVNSYVFKDPLQVMANIREVTRHVNARLEKSDCGIISFLDNRSGSNFVFHEDGYWRVCHFVRNSISYETAEDLRVLRSAGYAFGRFQYLLSDLPMNRLHDTIPNFHNTRKRLDDFFSVVAADPAGRVKEVQPEIDFFRSHHGIATKLVDLLESGELPLRVTHNDTKYNNILMDCHTCEPLCVIDLDTVMPGLSMYDFGDAIRFAANTACEDETDLTKVSLDMDRYEAFSRGFIEASKDILSQKELQYMALGAVVITMELASRFLADHLDGDRYFRIHRPHHNLDRARCQIQLASDMLSKFDEMNRIILETACVSIS